MIEYEILTYMNTSDLVSEVNKRLREGWELISGPVMNGGLIMQAMVRPEIEEDAEK